MQIRGLDRSKVMIRMAIGILVTLFVLLGWSVTSSIDREGFYTAFGTVLLVVFMRKVKISGVRLYTRKNAYYLRSIGNFYRHQISIADRANALNWFSFSSLRYRLFISTTRRQYCRRISISGEVLGNLAGLLSSYRLSPFPFNGATASTTYFKRKKYLERAHPNQMLAHSFNCSTKFPINGLTQYDA